MGQALYRNYRPRKFSEVVGQKHITSTLSNAIKAGRISHAYLFTGPKGVGKTSVARILAHEVNKLPYSDDSIHLDIIEIDAASNRRIDEIRDLRDRVRIAPSSAKYKVYIIDEVHMLTKEAFNALLKTLEEPPAHCIFILATTEAHKLPETIISRTQRFEFKPIGPEHAVDHLESIAKQEKIDISRDALGLLAQFGDGSFRDSISYLDQLSTFGKKISDQDVRDILGLPSSSEVKNLLNDVQGGQSQALLKDLDGVKDRGVNAAVLAAALAKEIRQMLIDGKNGAWIGPLLKQLIEVPASNRPSDNLEVILLEACSNNSPAGAPAKEDALPAKSSPASVTKNPELKAAASDVPERPSDKERSHFDLGDWDKVVEKARDKAASIYTALKLARPAMTEDGLTLSFDFPLHQKKLSLAKNKELLSGLIEEITGAKVPINCVVEKLDPKQGPSNKSEGSGDDPAISSISNIFGASEVLES